jgi:hypothetical protein
MYESIKKIILVDFPSLDFYPKLGVSLVVVSISFLLLVSLWRSPTKISSLDPAAEARLKEGVIAFFSHYEEISLDKIPVVYGNAKDIVRRMKLEKDVFVSVQMEIEQRKNNDNNWKFANELSEGKALVNALGLNYDTPTENQIFLQLPLPFQGLSPANKQIQPTAEGGG